MLLIGSACPRLKALVRPLLQLIQMCPLSHTDRLRADNVRDLFSAYDIVADGSDNFDTRFLVNDACHLAGKTLVSGAILRFEGQMQRFDPAANKKPCYRCLYRDKPPSGLVPAAPRAAWLEH